MPKDYVPNFLSLIATREVREGIFIRLETMREPGKQGPGLELLVSAEKAIELAHGILESVEDWKRKYRQN